MFLIVKKRVSNDICEQFILAVEAFIILHFLQKKFFEALILLKRFLYLMISLSKALVSWNIWIHLWLWHFLILPLIELREARLLLIYFNTFCTSDCARQISWVQWCVLLILWMIYRLQFNNLEICLIFSELCCSKCCNK